MTGETNLKTLLQFMQPILHCGEYVFCTINDFDRIDQKEILFYFKEGEGITLVVKKEIADDLFLPYTFVSSWITLNVHSSLEAVGFTAAFSKLLADKGIGCNVVAGYFHDHIFVDVKDTGMAMETLRSS